MRKEDCDMEIPSMMDWLQRLHVVQDVKPLNERQLASAALRQRLDEFTRFAICRRDLQTYANNYHLYRSTHAFKTRMRWHNQRTRCGFACLRPCLRN